MIIIQNENNNIIVKTIFDSDDDSFINNIDVLEFFKLIFKKLINKYNICGDVIVNFYIDNDFGMILDINNDIKYGSNVNTKIIIHLDCIFLVEVNYFELKDDIHHLYYYKNKFYTKVLKEEFYDGDIIYNSEDIIDKGIKMFR